MRPERDRQRQSTSAKRRRKKKLNEALGKIIPVFVALILIVVFVGVFYGSKLISRYKYSGKYADLSEYFGVYYDYQVGMIVNNQKVEDKGVYYKDSYYLSEEEVKKYFTNEFYINTDEQMALFTTQTEIVNAELNQSSDYCYYFGDEKRELSCAPVITNDGKTYFSVDYLKLFSDFNVQYFDNPKRMVIYTEDTSLETAKINKDTKVRYRGGVKSDILKDMSKDDTLYVLEEMEDWAKVQTLDGFIGYVEIKRYDKVATQTVSIERAEIRCEYTPIKFDGKINMAFHQLFDKSASNFTDDTKKAKGLNVVAPTWFRIESEDGSIKDIANDNYVANAHAAGVQVWAVWTDVDNETDMGKLFNTLEKRQSLISNMISLTKQHGIDGINLDFEKVPSTAGADWSEFLKELSIATHKEGIILSADNYAPTASTEHYNRAVQGNVCDYVIVMGYDEHWASSQEAGSVASINFVENGITNTIAAGVPGEKIINAIPFYTRVWKTKDGNVSSETLGMIRSSEWVKEVGMDLNWNDECCQYYGEKEMNSTLYQIWFEDAKSLQAKLSVMDAHGCAGVAEWKLGLETEEAWDTIQDYLNQ